MYTYFVTREQRSFFTVSGLAMTYHTHCLKFIFAIIKDAEKNSEKKIKEKAQSIWFLLKLIFRWVERNTECRPIEFHRLH